MELQECKFGLQQKTVYGNNFDKSSCRFVIIMGVFNETRCEFVLL